WLFRSPYAPRRLFFTSHTQQRDWGAAIAPFVAADRWRILSNGLDFSRYGSHAGAGRQLRASWALPDDAIAIGTACAIMERKRVDHLIRLVARLREANIPAYGFVAGEPHFPEHRALYADLQALAVSLGMGEYIRFLGYVEPSEPLYHAWDLLVNTSIYETFGMTVLEAMECGCAVVSYPSGSVAEIVGAGARIV